jgi:DNA-binding phage protein
MTDRNWTEITKLQPFQVADYLNTDEDIAEYLHAILEGGETDPATDAEVLRSAILDVIQALRKRTA